MAILVHKLLESKGFCVKEEHIDMLEVRWQKLLAMKEEIENDFLEGVHLGLCNIPGGDHID